MATLRVDEIKKILRERIEQHNRKVGIENIGRVVQVGEPTIKTFGSKLYCFIRSGQITKAFDG